MVISKATIKDVAEMSGVTPATVSYVINNTAKITLETRHRVMDAIEKLNYIPNDLAKSLKTKKSNMLGILLPNVSFVFYANISAIAEQVFQNYGYALFLCNTKYKPSLEKKYIQLLIEKNVEGILICDSLIDRSNYTVLQKAKMPFVCIDEIFRDEINAPTVCGDHNLGVEMMVTHLYQAGARKIVYVHIPMESNILDVRLKAFKKRMITLGLEPNVVLINMPQISFIESGYEIAHLLYQNLDHTDAIFAETDEIALGINMYFKERNVAVPQDVLLAGYDGSSMSKISSPALTTIDQNIEKLAGESAKSLLDLIQSDRIQNLTITPTLLIRESTTR
jgi:LacI family transcriptional regulator